MFLRSELRDVRLGVLGIITTVYRYLDDVLNPASKAALAMVLPCCSSMTAVEIVLGLDYCRYGEHTPYLRDFNFEDGFRLLEIFLNNVAVRSPGKRFSSG